MELGHGTGVEPLQSPSCSHVLVKSFGMSGNSKIIPGLLRFYAYKAVKAGGQNILHLAAQWLDL